MIKKLELTKRFGLKVIALLLIALAVFILFRYINLEKIPGSSTIVVGVDQESSLEEDSNVITAKPEDVIKEANIGDNAESYSKSFSLEKGFADLAEYAIPSVVNISAVRVVKTSTSDVVLEGIDPSLRDLFKQFMPDNMPQQNQSFVSLGSGFVIRSDGFIITNYHVIKESENIQVTFTDGTKYNAKIYATDEVTDLALLKIEAVNLKTLKFGDSDAARVGEWVIAIGNPFGLGGTVSSGIISAKGRDINMASLNDFIQTDAAINRGNSGGPLINIKGEVIGINTAIFSTSGGSIGIGFSVPSKTIETVVSQLITKGKVIRGWLGVQIQAIDNNIAKSLGLSNTDGALVSSVLPNSPAASAGLKTGDVIVAVNGQKVKNSRILPRLVTAFPPGSIISLDVLSGKSKKVVKVKIGEIPEQQIPEDSDKSTQNKGANIAFKEKTYEDLGLRIAEINPAIRKHFSLADDTEGLIVAAVAISSPLQYKGLYPGLILISVNQKDVKTLDDLDKILNTNPDPLLILAEDASKNRYFLSITKKELEQGYLDQQ